MTSRSLFLTALTCALASCSPWKESPNYPVSPTELLANVCAVIERQGFTVTTRNEDTLEFATDWALSDDPQTQSRRRTKLSGRVEGSGGSSRVLIESVREGAMTTIGSSTVWLNDGRDQDLEEKILTILTFERIRRRLDN